MIARRGNKNKKGSAEQKRTQHVINKRQTQRGFLVCSSSSFIFLLYVFSKTRQESQSRSNHTFHAVVRSIKTKTRQIITHKHVEI
jgi:hypothetical protein